MSATAGGGSSGTTAGTGGGDGLFGSIKTAFEGIGQGVSFIGREILPVFAARELLQQQDDQLKQPTFVFNPGANPSTQFNNDGTPVENPNSRPAGFLFDNLNISGAGIAIAAAAVLATILLLRR